MCENYDTYEMYVCVDCYMEHHHNDNPEHHAIMQSAMERELGDKSGHLSSGIIVDKPENDCHSDCGDCYDCDDYNASMEQYEAEVENDGYEEFSWSPCDVCRTKLGGSRHGMTLFIEKPKVGKKS